VARQRRKSGFVCKFTTRRSAHDGRRTTRVRSDHQQADASGDEERVNELIGIVGLAGYSHIAIPKPTYGGQRQRHGAARAMRGPQGAGCSRGSARWSAKVRETSGRAASAARERPRNTVLVTHGPGGGAREVAGHIALMKRPHRKS